MYIIKWTKPIWEGYMIPTICRSGKRKTMEAIKRLVIAKGWACMLSHFSHVWLCNLMDCSPLCSSAMGFSRKDTGVDYHALLQGDLPQPEIKSMSLMSPVLAGKFCTTSATWEALRVGQRRMNGQSSDLYSSRNIMISICHYTFVQGHGICTTPRVNP